MSLESSSPPIIDSASSLVDHRSNRAPSDQHLPDDSAKTPPFPLRTSSTSPKGKEAASDEEPLSGRSNQRLVHVELGVDEPIRSLIDRLAEFVPPIGLERVEHVWLCGHRKVRARLKTRAFYGEGVSWDVRPLLGALL